MIARISLLLVGLLRLHCGANGRLYLRDRTLLSCFDVRAAASTAAEQPGGE